jgi:hypothetical protein
MLVTFTCKAHADIIMFGDVAVHLLKLMGHSGTVPGALKPEDIPAALERLQRGVESEIKQADANSSGTEDNDEEYVSLSHRALPLIDLLKAAARADCDVMWDRNT